ncbi:hypothetical protein JCM17823_12350 [Halorubrum gandharaense]
MRRRRFLAGSAACSLATVAGCGTTPGGENGNDSDDEEHEGPPAAVVESELVRENEGTDEESVRVEGIVERTRDEEITYLEVRAVFFDENGEPLERTVEHVGDVTEGDRWSFSVAYSGIGESAARVADHDAEVVENP